MTGSSNKEKYQSMGMVGQEEHLGSWQGGSGVRGVFVFSGGNGGGHLRKQRDVHIFLN